MIKFKITALPAILAKIQNGVFVYHNKFKVSLSTPSHCLPHLHRIAWGCLHHVTITTFQNNNKGKLGLAKGHSPLRHLC